MASHTKAVYWIPALNSTKRSSGALSC